MKTRKITQVSSTLPASTSETNLTGKVAVEKITLPAFADATSGDYIYIPAMDGTIWAVALDKTGSAPAPTGALYTSVPAANKAKCDISAQTTAADVATAVQVTLAALTGIAGSITVGSASGADIPLTMINRGVIALPTPKNANDSGAGSITSAATTAGVVSSINIAADTITLAATAFVTGDKVAVSINSGSLPAPLTATTYYVIKLSTNTIQLALTQAQAVAGTAINLTDQGTADKTITFARTVNQIAPILVGAAQKISIQSIVTGGSSIGALSLQVSDDGVSFVDVSSSSQNITSTVDQVIWELDLYSEYIRLLWTNSSGSGSVINTTYFLKSEMEIG